MPLWKARGCQKDECLFTAFGYFVWIILDSGPVECPVQFQGYLVTRFNSIGVWMNSWWFDVLSCIIFCVSVFGLSLFILLSSWSGHFQTKDPGLRHFTPGYPRWFLCAFPIKSPFNSKINWWFHQFHWGLLNSFVFIVFMCFIYEFWTIRVKVFYNQGPRPYLPNLAEIPTKSIPSLFKSILDPL